MTIAWHMHGREPLKELLIRDVFAFSFVQILGSALPCCHYVSRVPCKLVTPWVFRIRVVCNQSSGEGFERRNDSSTISDTVDHLHGAQVIDAGIKTTLIQKD